jgi:hypothetical protein
MQHSTVAELRNNFLLLPITVSSNSMVVGDMGSLQSGGDTENIWAYSDNGTPFRDGLLLLNM